MATEIGPGPWEIGGLGPTEPGADGVRALTLRNWMRTAAPVPDDPDQHDARLAFMTDHHLDEHPAPPPDGDTRGIISVDHAVWFHRRAGVDDWLHYDAHSPVNTNGRSVLRGAIHGPDRRLAASVTQETLLRPYEKLAD